MIDFQGSSFSSPIFDVEKVLKYNFALLPGFDADALHGIMNDVPNEWKWVVSFVVAVAFSIHTSDRLVTINFTNCKLNGQPMIVPKELSAAVFLKHRQIDLILQDKVQASILSTC